MRIQRQPLVTVAYLGGIPALPEPFVYSLLRMAAYSAEVLDFQVHYDRATTSLHSYARNTLVKRFQGDWLLQLDTDHEFEPDLLARMLNTALNGPCGRLPVVSGLYQYKVPPYQPNAYLWSEKPGKASPLGWWDKANPVFRVDAVGGGCLLVHRDVFDRIRNELREEPFECCKPPEDTSGPMMGEDISFCHRLKQLGIPLYLDTRIKVKHLRWQTVDMEDFERHATQYKLSDTIEREVA